MAKVLIACEFSGIVREEFRKLGHDAWSCDLLDTEIPGNHIKDDVLKHLDKGWDLMIAHPPCTFLSNSGVRWLHTKDGRWENMEEGAKFFKKLLEADIPKKAIENPIMHKYAVEIIGRRQDQLIQPYMFGHLEQKATCFWIHNLPLLKPTRNVKSQMNKLSIKKTQKVHYAPPSNDRWRVRSKTLKGIARAMAKQWGEK